jgi:diguanylate cyclase (GGDEF)-like protein/PAS domain S-box-containing protein
VQSLLFDDANAMRALIDALPIAVFVKDAQSRFRLMNQACEQQWGIDFATVRDTDASQVFPPEQMANFLARDREVFASGQQTEYEESFWNAAMQQSRIGHTVKKPVYDASGQPLCLICMTTDITEKRIIDQDLRLSEEKLRTLFEMLPLGIIRNAMDGTFVEANAAFLNTIGYTQEDLHQLSYWDLTPKRYADEEQRQLESLQTRAKYGPYEKEYIHRSGRHIPVRLNGVEITGSDNQKYIWSLVEDIYDQKKTEESLRIAATAFESQEGMMVTDADSNILRVNQAFSVITGYSADEVVGKHPRLLCSGRYHPDFYKSMWKSISKTGSWKGEIWNRRKNGEIYPQHLSIIAVKDVDGKSSNYVATMVDLTHSKAAAEKIEQLAFYDPLTHLPNRRLLLDRLKQALASSVRSGRQGAILFLDLDHFKNLNDTLGHDVGDQLLQQVAQRLSSCIREDDTVARMGGDEFVVVLEDLSEHDLDAAEHAETVANKILSRLNLPYELGLHVHRNTPSIGITLFSDPKHGIEERLKQAEIAMYQAKRAGRNIIRFFDPGMQESINSRTAMENAMREALESQQFQLYYQIQVDSAGQALGAEALIRWIHPERGMVSPAQFIPLAEETGLILPIGDWVLDTACAQLKAWQTQQETRTLALSVNVSAKQFHQPHFVTQVQEAVQRHGIDPNYLKLELTEGALLENVNGIIATMSALRQIGIQFSLDDFGTGYSSLQYLKQLPLDQLKIDQSFVRDIVGDSSDQAIVQTIIAMAQSLELAVIAEGVETEEQKLLLLTKGCRHFQGYLFGKPVPITVFNQALPPCAKLQG